MNTNTVGYDVLESTVLSVVVSGVNERIREGWTPLGGIVVVPLTANGPVIYVQAMICVATT